MSLSYSTLPAKFAFTGISKNLDKVNPTLSIMQLLENCELMMVENLNQDQSSIISFRISEEFISLKGLFNGLISLGQPKGINLSYHSNLNSYRLVYDASSKLATANYIIKLISMIEEEIRFKNVLRTLLENQKSFDASQQLLRKEIFK